MTKLNMAKLINKINLVINSNKVGSPKIDIPFLN